MSKPQAVHLLIDMTDQGRTMTTGCGEKRSRRQNTDPLPEDLTGWSSAVTCPACLARSTA